jgi:glycosyltransferase involved in cell wall biosynthesis
VIEAYAVGVPVLSSNIGSLSEAVEDGISGLLLPPDDAETWARGVRELLDDRRNLALGAAAYELWQRNYRPDAAIRRLEASYEAAREAHDRRRMQRTS